MRAGHIAQGSHGIVETVKTRDSLAGKGRHHPYSAAVVGAKRIHKLAHRQVAGDHFPPSPAGDIVHGNASPAGPLPPGDGKPLTRDEVFEHCGVNAVIFHPHAAVGRADPRAAVAPIDIKGRAQHRDMGRPRLHDKGSFVVALHVEKRRALKQSNPSLGVGVADIHGTLRGQGERAAVFQHVDLPFAGGRDVVRGQVQTEPGQEHQHQAQGDGQRRQRSFPVYGARLAMELCRTSHAIRINS